MLSLLFSLYISYILCGTFRLALFYVMLYILRVFDIFSVLLIFISRNEHQKQYCH